MNDLDTKPAVHPKVHAQLAAAGKLPDVTVLKPPPGPAKPLTKAELVEAAWSVLDDFGFHEVGKQIAELTTRRPWIEDVAWLEFEDAQLHGTNGALVGNFAYQYYDALFKELGFTGVVDLQPKARITLDYIPTGGGNLVTCRVFSSAVGPVYPGYYHITGPGGTVKVKDKAGGSTILSYVVPAFSASPAKIEISTNRNEIAVWSFRDCVVTQL